MREDKATVADNRERPAREQEHRSATDDAGRGYQVEHAVA
jgi:hypothetical protein